MSQFLLNGGNILLATAFMLSVAASIFLFRAKDGNSLQLNAAKKIYYISAIFILIALVHLLIAILSDDFRFLYVYSNSERAMPLLYKIAALWAGNEGSFLFWLAMMSFLVFS
jgi:cytochrome c-type biogenesis protein CcmF